MTGNRNSDELPQGGSVTNKATRLALVSALNALSGVKEAFLCHPQEWTTMCKVSLGCLLTTLALGTKH